MNCPGCGIRVNEEWSSCPACGAKLETEKRCGNCGRTVENDWNVCPSCGNILKTVDHSDKKETSEGEQSANENEWKANSMGNKNQYQNDIPEQTPIIDPNTYVHPMKWYKFLVNFFLVFIAVCEFIAAFSLVVTALVFNAVESTPVSMFVWLAISIIVTVTYGVYTISLRNRLKNRKKSAAFEITVFWFIAPVISLINLILLNSIFYSTDIFSDIVVGGIMFWINHVYFGRRKDYFNM